MHSHLITCEIGLIQTQNYDHSAVDDNIVSVCREKMDDDFLTFEELIQIPAGEQEP